MFKLKLNQRFSTGGKQVKNISGHMVVFRDGEAIVDEEIARLARRYHFIGGIIKLDEVIEVDAEELNSAFVELTDAANLALANAVTEAAKELETKSVDTEVETKVDNTEVETVVDTKVDTTVSEETDSDEVVEATDIEEPDVNALYEELGTWTAVAQHLGITTAALKKLRS